MNNREVVRMQSSRPLMISHLNTSEVFRTAELWTSQLGDFDVRMVECSPWSALKEVSKAFGFPRRFGNLRSFR